MASEENKTIESPFAHFVQEEWMWKQKPPLTRPVDLARVLDIPLQTASNWLRRGFIPEAGSLIVVASKTGLSFLKLLEVCGYPLPEGVVETKDLVDFMAQRFEHDAHKSYTPEEVANRIREYGEEYRAAAS